MEIVDKTSNKQEEWAKGDVLKDKNGYKALIVQNNDNLYCLMDIYNDNNITQKYSTSDESIYGNACSSIDELYCTYYGEWHKVNAKLVIE